jgi:hypothetical protein
MQHRHGRAAWTWSCSMDIGLWHGHGHALRTWTCSMNWDMRMSMSILRLHGQVCSFCMSNFKSMLNVLVHAHVLVHAASSFPCCMSNYMLRVPIHAASPCPCPCCMSISMLHVHVNAACSSQRKADIDLHHELGHASWT